MLLARSLIFRGCGVCGGPISGKRYRPLGMNHSHHNRCRLPAGHRLPECRCARIQVGFYRLSRHALSEWYNE